MPAKKFDSTVDKAAGKAANIEVQRQAALLKTGALQSAILSFEIFRSMPSKSTRRSSAKLGQGTALRFGG